MNKDFKSHDVYFSSVEFLRLNVFAQFRLNRGVLLKYYVLKLFLGAEVITIEDYQEHVIHFKYNYDLLGIQGDIVFARSGNDI